MYTFRTRAIVQDLEPIRTKIEKLDVLKSCVPEDMLLSLEDVCDLMEDVFNTVSQFQEPRDYKQNEEAYMKLKISLHDFNMALQLMKMKGMVLDPELCNQISIVNKDLLESVCQVLIKEESVTIEKLMGSLSGCQNALERLQDVQDIEAIVSFKNFVGEVLDSKQLLTTHALGLVSKKQRNLMLLCINQIGKCVILMLKTYQCHWSTSTAPSFKESMQYLSARLKWCFSQILQVIEAVAPSTTDEKEECGGLFVQRMDQALEILAAVKVDDEFQDVVCLVRKIIEELLCHAMAIGQVSTTKDSANITVCCQKVLSVLENIKEESARDVINTSVRQNLCYALADALESLEQEVNNSLLRLVLEVFCEPYAPLRTLVKACAETSTVDRKAEDLDDMIVDLDLHVDRVMQIGMFAMACSGDVKRILCIRSCLASLESLEPELVPALTTYYLDVEKSGHRNHVKMLSCHWQSEILQLEKLIDGIVDPAAFCQIIYDDIYQLTKTFKASLHKEKSFLKDLVYKIYTELAKLVRHLSISTHEMEPVTSQLNILDKVKELSWACDECIAVANIIFSEDCDDDSVTYFQLLKRCKLIASLMKKVQPALSELMNYSQPLKKPADVIRVKEEDDGLNFPDSIKDLPLDISDQCSTDERKATEDSNVNCSKSKDLIENEENLQPFLQRGRQLCQERSILYQTPKSVKKPPRLVLSSPQNESRCRVPKRLFSRDDSVNAKEESTHLMSVNDTLGLEITEILDKLTSLSDTLTPENESQKC